jgi:hypothetical protein
MADTLEAAIGGAAPVEELVTVQEAASLLGVHPNTIRNRIKAGQYTAEWAPSPHGPRQLISRVQLVCNPSQDPVVVRDDSNGSHNLLLVREQQEAALQRVLVPFVDRLEAVTRENGRLQEANRNLEAEVARLRTELAQREEPSPLGHDDTPQEPAPAKPSWWRRLLFGPGA